jgi:hypothetical protein
VAQYTDKFKSAVWKLFKETKHGKGYHLKEANHDFVNAGKIEVNVESSAEHFVEIINAHQFTSKVDRHYTGFFRSLEIGSLTMQVCKDHQPSNEISRSTNYF